MSWKEYCTLYTDLIRDHVAHAVHVVVLVVVSVAAPGPRLAGDGVQVGVVDGEGGVVLLQDAGRRALDGQLAHRVGAGLAVRTADHPGHRHIVN